jgi:hypothetical protein
MRQIFWQAVRKQFSARHYAMHELDKFIEAYAQAWSKFSVSIAGHPSLAQGNERRSIQSCL